MKKILILLSVLAVTNTFANTSCTGVDMYGSNDTFASIYNSGQSMALAGVGSENMYLRLNNEGNFENAKFVVIFSKKGKNKIVSVRYKDDGTLRAEYRNVSCGNSDE